ncbi:DUF2071 domain-containing protein [Streptomyces longispororuber]|nr:DUF2071 domain-containing protein [Streptomyces longispororuber]
MAALLPPGAAPDLYQGRAYVGLVFFRMENLALGAGPRLPHAGTFNEVNVRLYSRDTSGRRGVVFRSLDCDRLASVVAARGAFGLAYQWSRVSHRWFGDDRRLLYRSRRRSRSPARSHVWLDVVPEVHTRASQLESFLTNRWGLHERVLGRTYYLPNTHPQWSFLRCSLLGWDASVVGDSGLGPPAGEPVSVLYSPGLPVRFGLPSRLSA